MKPGINFGEIITQASELSQRFFRAVVQTLRNPQADPKQTLLIGGLLIIFAIIFVLIGFTISTAISRWRRKRGALPPIEEERIKPRPPAPRTHQQIIISWAITGFIVLIFLVAASIYTGRPSFCANCHKTTGEYESWKQSPHKSVTCLGCHQQPGVSGWTVQKFDYLRWVTVYATDAYEKPIRATVSNVSCKRCHRRVQVKTSTSHGIKVRHRDFLQKGSRCTDCHNTVAHGDVVPTPRYPTMDKCISCHNTEIASAECKVCHAADTAKRWRAEKSKFVRIDVSRPKNCRGCHKLSTWEQCIRCHGLEMPHPEGWRDGHARLAFLNKSVCQRCHSFPAPNKSLGTHGGNVGDGTFCNICHSFPSPHGTVERWKRMHGPIAQRKVFSIEEACKECHGYGSIELCSECHSERMCDRCHQPGKYKLPKD